MTIKCSWCETEMGEKGEEEGETSTICYMCNWLFFPAEMTAIYRKKKLLRLLTLGGNHDLSASNAEAA